MSAAAQPDRGALRWARVAAFTVPAVGFAVLLHAAAHGCVSLQGLAEAAVSSLAAGGMLLQREQSRARITAWLVACQALTHLLLQVHCPTGRAAGFGPDTRMLAAHVAAAVVAAAFLAPAERALWSAWRIGSAVRRAAVRCLRRPTPVIVPVVSLSRLISDTPVVLPVVTRHCPPPVRRGPPAVVALA